jgi:hypothetical protein
MIPEFAEIERIVARGACEASAHADERNSAGERRHRVDFARRNTVQGRRPLASVGTPERR